MWTFVRITRPLSILWRPNNRNTTACLETWIFFTFYLLESGFWEQPEMSVSLYFKASHMLRLWGEKTTDNISDWSALLWLESTHTHTLNIHSTATKIATLLMYWKWKGKHPGFSQSTKMLPSGQEQQNCSMLVLYKILLRRSIFMAPIPSPSFLARYVLLSTIFGGWVQVFLICKNLALCCTDQSNTCFLVNVCLPEKKWGEGLVWSFVLN